ncbi:MAG: hypothetical protein ACPHLK_11225 [Gammaproteobacteria bacterium]|jgi:hypothetical protein
MDNTSNPSLHTLRLPAKQSPILLRFVACAHILCLIMIWLNSLILMIKMVMSCFIGISFYVFFHRTKLNKAVAAIDSLILDSEDNWQVKMLDGTIYPAELGDNLFVHPCLTIICLNFNHRRQFFIFTPEILDADIFRRLRVRLRFRVGEKL